MISTLTASGDIGGASFSQKVSTPIDVKFGVGYRFGGESKDGKPAANGFDLRFNFDIGEFESLSATIASETIEGDIVKSKQAAHYAMGLNLGYVFMP